MTISTAFFLLSICSVLTGLIVEGIKKMVEVKRPNVVAAIVAVMIGIIIPLGYTIILQIKIDATIIAYVASICLLSWLCAMLGYDKVIQTISQLERD